MALTTDLVLPLADLLLVALEDWGQDFSEETDSHLPLPPQPHLHPHPCLLRLHLHHHLQQHLLLRLHQNLSLPLHRLLNLLWVSMELALKRALENSATEEPDWVLVLAVDLNRAQPFLEQNLLEDPDFSEETTFHLHKLNPHQDQSQKTSGILTTGWVLVSGVQDSVRVPMILDHPKEVED